MKILVTMREEAGFPFPISSGYRCPAYNQQVSDSGLNGPHTTGLAADILVNMKQALEVVRLGLKHGMTGYGISQKGDLSKRFIHVDCLTKAMGFPRPAIFSY